MCSAAAVLESGVTHVDDSNEEKFEPPPPVLHMCGSCIWVLMLWHLHNCTWFLYPSLTVHSSGLTWKDHSEQWLHCKAAALPGGGAGMHQERVESTTGKGGVPSFKAIWQ